MELSPEKIYQEFLKKKLDKPSVVKLLLSLIESSESNKVRVDCIKKLEYIRAVDNNSFKFLENLLISDSSLTVRNTAALVLKSLFIDKSFELMKWVLFHEESPSCLRTIHMVLIEIINSWAKSPDPMVKSQLLGEVEKIKKKEVNLGFEVLCEIEHFDTFSNRELADILINYFTVILFKKSYWRLKYKIEECKITELDFIFKDLTALPVPIRYLSSLKSLSLRYNQLTTLPNWIDSLHSLESLNLNINNIKILPKSIGNLKSLKELFLWNNELESLPQSIEGLEKLKNINLKLNNLTNLPKTIGKIVSLKELNLHDNLLKELPKSIKNLVNLDYLDLSWNTLKSLPESIGFLSSLKVLNLERNELITLPESIGGLSSLEILNISDNKLKKIPESIKNLKSLQYINLSRNKLEVIPESILSLTSLKKIYLGENNFNESSEIINILKQEGIQVYF